MHHKCTKNNCFSQKDAEAWSCCHTAHLESQKYHKNSICVEEKERHSHLTYVEHRSKAGRLCPSMKMNTYANIDPNTGLVVLFWNVNVLMDRQ